MSTWPETGGRATISSNSAFPSENTLILPTLLVCPYPPPTPPSSFFHAKHFASAQILQFCFKYPNSYRLTFCSSPWTSILLKITWHSTGKCHAAVGSLPWESLWHAQVLMCCSLHTVGFWINKHVSLPVTHLSCHMCNLHLDYIYFHITLVSFSLVKSFLSIVLCFLLSRFPFFFYCLIFCLRKQFKIPFFFF